MICPCCGGEGVTDVSTGWRQTGWGLGDCEETYDVEECIECRGSGSVEQEDVDDEG